MQEKPEPEAAAELLPSVPARRVDLESRESRSRETRLRNAGRCEEGGTRVTEGSGTRSATRADPLSPWSEGRAANSKSCLNKGVVPLSVSRGTCWTGLLDWEGRSKGGKGAVL